MKQIVRSNTFETNSSSMHSLVILSKEDFENFKNKSTFLCSENWEFIEYKDIPNLQTFKEEYPDAKENEIEYLIDEFKDNYFDTDYAVGYSYEGLDTCYESVYDKEGKESIALSYYIGDC